MPDLPRTDTGERAPERAAEIAATKTGLRPDQVVAAVEEYRAALLAMTVEPAWQAIMHMHGAGMAIAQYGGEGTEVCLQVDSWKERGDWVEQRTYTFGGKPFETFTEARAAEEIAKAKFVVRPLPSSHRGTE